MIQRNLFLFFVAMLLNFFTPGCGQNTTDKAITDGDLAFKAGNYALAIKNYKKVSWIGKYPANIAYQIGFSQEKLGNLKKAAKYYFKAAEKDPNNPVSNRVIAELDNWPPEKRAKVKKFKEKLARARLRRGKALAKKGETERALEEYGKSPVVSPELLYEKSDVFVKKGDFTAAYKQLSQAYRIKPEEKCLDKMDKILSKLSSSHKGDYYNKRMALGNIKFQKGYYDEAMRHFKKIPPAGISYQSSEVLYKIGYCYEKARKKEKAMEYYKKAIIAQPGSEWAKKAGRQAPEIKKDHIFNSESRGTHRREGVLPPPPKNWDWKLRSLYKSYEKASSDYLQAVRAGGGKENLRTMINLKKLQKAKKAYEDYLREYSKKN
ncbi:tetratricopeptide repeat protein [Candidatus Riflebacteria bacterium]